MIKKLKQYIKAYIIKRLSINTQDKFIPNINLDFTKNQKKVLVMYLDMVGSGKDIFSKKNGKQSGSCHTNRYELFQIINALIRLDCCIDVCGNGEEEAKQYIETKQYDAIIGLGEMFRYACKHSRAYKILYMTENPYYISYQREKERVDYFKQRTGKEVPLFRTGMFFKENDEGMADAIICMGEEKYFEHLGVPVKRILPSAFLNEEFCDYSKRKKENFLVFGTDGFIHKGNDLLVEVFNRHPEWTLYMCGYNVSGTIENLGLKKSENIIDCGYIQVNSDKFKELAELCTFIILPSCSEGLSTAVLTGMRHAMIPIITKGNGLDKFPEYCLYFDGYQVEDIEEKIQQAVRMPEEEILQMQKRIDDFSNSKFTLETFTEQIYIVFKQLIYGEK